MRRNTLLPHNNSVTIFKNRRHRTLIETGHQMTPLTQQFHSHNFSLMNSESVVREFMDQTLMDRIEEEMNQRQLKKIVDQTMNQCINLFQNENWQIDPNGPFMERLKQHIVKPDEQPHVRHFHPMLGFQKAKISKQQQIASQSQISLSRFKPQTNKNEPKSSFTKAGSRNSIKTSKSLLSKQNLFDFPKLIPLKLENKLTPQSSTKRTLQDFLREKKINAEINLGYKMKYISEQKQNMRTIQQFPKSSFFLMTSRNNTASTANQQLKLPLVSARDDYITDYNGEGIPLKKSLNFKKTTEILKTICKLKGEADQQTKRPKRDYPRFEQIKFRQTSLKDESLNLSMFSARMNTQSDMKTLIEQSLQTNRLKFRQINSTRGKFSYEESKSPDIE